ncbi:MAG: YesL family protein [Firmicutes bacterium]|nr:YesL family protein [Bacillota bacterium]
MAMFERGIFSVRLPAEGSTEKQGMPLFFSILFQNVSELLRLNLLFLLFCLPVVTIPAAITAMSNVTFKMVREEVFFFREDFIGAFRQNFWKSLALGGPALVILAAAVFLIPFYRSAVAVSPVFYAPLALVALTVIFVFLMSLYVFPLLAAVELSIGKIIRNAALLALVRLPYNALALLSAAFLLLLVILTLPVSLLIIAACLFSLFSLIGSFCAWSGIRKYVVKGG